MRKLDVKCPAVLVVNDIQKLATICIVKKSINKVRKDQC